MEPSAGGLRLEDVEAAAAGPPERTWQLLSTTVQESVFQYCMLLCWLMLHVSSQVASQQTHCC